MFRISIFFSLCFLAFSFGLNANQPKTICLNMIVKNESKAIERCLESVKNFVDYWVIFDTGSTDGTQEIIKEYMKGIPGELHEAPWVDFAHNRNLALEVAKNKGDYSLFIDADEILVGSKPCAKQDLTKDYYIAIVRRMGVDCPTILMVNNQLDWKWKGVLHEEVIATQAKTFGTLKEVMKVCDQEDGYRSQDPKKYYKDAQTLEKALENEPNNSRYVFFLAQSYFVIQEYALALKNYGKRINMGGWNEEIFWSLYSIGLCQEGLKVSSNVIIDSYCKAFQYRPIRAEPLFRLAQLYRTNGNSLLGYIVLNFALSIPMPQETMYVEHWIYDYGLLLEFSNCAYNLEKYHEANKACIQLLLNNKLPDGIRKFVENNLFCLKSKI